MHQDGTKRYHPIEKTHRRADGGKVERGPRRPSATSEDDKESDVLRSHLRMLWIKRNARSTHRSRSLSSPSLVESVEDGASTLDCSTLFRLEVTPLPLK